MTNEEALKIATSSNGLLHGANPNLKSEYIMCIIEALGKQIPKKPSKTIDTSWGITNKVHVCPVCDYYLTETHFIGEGAKISYCGTCGQKIDWSEEE